MNDSAQSQAMTKRRKVESTEDEGTLEEFSFEKIKLLQDFI
jgi:hypothetical protein